jgi:hypothetical protein
LNYLTDERYIIESFTLDEENFNELSKLITEAFLSDENTQIEGTTILFDEETFSRMFGSPHTPNDTFVRALDRETKEIVGFIGSIPRNIMINGEKFKFIIPAWAAVATDHKRKGLALKMGLKILDLLFDKGYEAGFSLFEPEQKGINTGASVSRHSDKLLPLKRILTIKKFLIRVFDVDRVSEVMNLKWYEKRVIKLFEKIQKVDVKSTVRKSKPEDFERIFELMNDHVERNQMSIVRDKDDFEWYLNQPGVNCVVHEDENGIVNGFLLAWKFNFAGYGKTIPFGWVDIIHLYRLSIKEATELCRYFAIISKELGWVGLQSPFIPYFDPKPFRKSKFILFPKILTMDAFQSELRRKIPFPEKIESFYFDWR